MNNDIEIIDESRLPENMVVKPMAFGTNEHIINGGFETPDGWTLVGIDWDTAYTTESVYKGTHSLKLTSDSASNSPYK